MKSPSALRVSPLAALICTFLLLTAEALAGVPGSASPVPVPSAEPGAAATINIPGPLRSFMRMAGISQQVATSDLLPLLSRNVYYQGYEGPPESGHATEFLVLLSHYIQQARDLTTLAGPDAVIRVKGCQDAEPLLRVLGYRVRGVCGDPHATLETADSDRAFLTIDSGFPLPELERSMQTDKPFSYPYAATAVPVLFTPNDWVMEERRKNGQDLLDALLQDRNLARLYWAMSHMDLETRDSLRQSPGLAKLSPYASIVDFYGSYLCIRSGRVLVPGGAAAEPAWRNLVGASPDNPGQFTFHLVSRDRGWMAAFFDALSRVSPSQQAHFVDGHRLKRDYEALREEDPRENAARPVFRPDPGLLLLLTRLQWEPTGEPHVPGNLAAWKDIIHDTKPSVSGKWRKEAAHWNSPEQLLEAMFALSRARTESGPLQIYLAATELDSRRAPSHSLKPETVRLLARNYAQFSSQYLIFSEFPELDDSSISSFLSAAQKLSDLHDHVLRGNAMGAFQAEVGMWQILARQHEIPREGQRASWQALMRSYSHVDSPTQLFDQARYALRDLLVSAGARPDLSQDEIIALLAGPHQLKPDDQRIHRELADRMRSVMDGQRLISLDTILSLGDGLHDVAGVKANTDTLLRLAGALREFEMPRPIFSMSERDEWATGIYNSHHTDLQMKTDLSKVIKSPESDQQLAGARGQLTPFLRDTLVGLNYAYYEPPGAQLLHDNPLFVRSHDFAGDTVTGLEERLWQSPQLFGQGAPAGGGAHFIGSLADLPYALAEAEQNFITPENVQALIWEQMVPGLLTSSVVPRWWGISRNELHAVALYQEAGEELLRAAGRDAELREKVLGAFVDRMDPQQIFRLQEALASGHVENALAQVTPAETFHLTAEFRRRFPQQTDVWGPSGKELEALSQSDPADTNWEKLSHDFGVPHPLLAESYERELLDVAPFPAFTGYSSRLLAESWDSNNLYWARLADEMGYAPAMLNQLVPELTRRMVEKIFATDQEDWAALLRATRETGAEFRQGKIASLTMIAGATN